MELEIRVNQDRITIWANFVYAIIDTQELRPNLGSAAKSASKIIFNEVNTLRPRTATPAYVCIFAFFLPGAGVSDEQVPHFTAPHWN